MITHLHGQLKELAPDGVTLEVDNIPQLLRALESIYPEFREKLKEADEYAFIRKSGDQFLEITEAELLFPLETDELHIIPSIEGSGFEIAVAWGLTAGTFGYYAVGIALNVVFSLALSAVASALAPTPKSAGAASPREESPSYIFRGAQNISQPGAALPLVYGEVLTGSVVISVGISSEDIAV